MLIFGGVAGLSSIIIIPDRLKKHSTLLFFAHCSAANVFFSWPSNQGGRTRRINGHTGSLAVTVLVMFLAPLVFYVGGIYVLCCNRLVVEPPIWKKKRSSILDHFTKSSR